MIRNQSVIAASAMTALVTVALLPMSRPGPKWWEYAALVLSPFVLYGIARAVDFSLVKQLLN
jgi:uncharacterized membrane protein YeiH